MSIVLFSAQSAAGSTLSVQQWKMLDPPFSGSSVARHSLGDWHPVQPNTVDPIYYIGYNTIDLYHQTIGMVCNVKAWV